MPHVDCVSFPAASKHDDHCRRGGKFSHSLGTPHSNRFGPITTLIHQDATLELRVRTVKYFKDMWQVGHFLEKAAIRNISR